MAGCRPLTDEEINLVRNSFTGRFASRNKTFFEVGIRTGYRVSELLSIKVSDVEQHGVIKDTITVEPRHMKGKRRGRTLVVHAAAKAAIAEHLNDYERKWGRRMTPEMFLFRSQTGVNRALSRTQLSKILHDIYDSHKLMGKLGSHALRKSFAQKMYKAFGRDIVKVQSALGHSSLNSTAAYLRNFTSQEIDDAILA